MSSDCSEFCRADALDTGLHPDRVIPCFPQLNDIFTCLLGRYSVSLKLLVLDTNWLVHLWLEVSSSEEKEDLTVFCDCLCFNCAAVWHIF